MATFSELPYVLQTREYEKFELTAAGEVAVRTLSTPSGLNTAGLITEVTLNSLTWTALPLSSLAGRNAMGIQNTSNLEIKINFDSGILGYVGWRVAPNGELFLDVRQDVIVYAKSKNGNPVVTILEVS